MNKTIWATTQDLYGAPDCKIAFPAGATGRLPVVFLLHGQFDTEEDWWTAKGQLPRILAEVDAPPMLLVMPFCAEQKCQNPRDQGEPKLADFVRRFQSVETALSNRFSKRIDPERRAILGISMGGKQALAVVLTSGRKTFSALGVLSAKLQNNNKTELQQFVKNWPQDWRLDVANYFHYCGRAGRDATLYPNNMNTCTELGGQLQFDPQGDHNWRCWRPQISVFLTGLIPTC